MKPPQNEILVFLDVDGVLNNSSDPTVSRQALDAGALAELKGLMDAVPGARIILSSAWRLVAKMTRLLAQQLEAAGIEAPVGATSVVAAARSRPGEPSSLDRQLARLADQRAAEILQAVRERRPRAWLAVDDLDLSHRLHERHFVRTDEAAGLTEGGRRRAVGALQGQLEPRGVT